MNVSSQCVDPAGREEFLLSALIELETELEALARFVCHDLGHAAGEHFGCCDSCQAFATRIVAFQKAA